MADGLLVVNDNNIVQIDSNYVNQKLAWSTTLPAARFGNIVASQINFKTECPLVFIRTSGMFGGFELQTNDPSYPAGNILYYSTAPVDFAFFTISAPDATGNTGFQVFNAAGRLVYNSENTYARIQDIAVLNGSATSGSASFSAQAARPWICANPITPSLSVPFASGSDISYPPWMIAVTYTNSSISYTMPENGDIQENNKATNAQLNPYYGRTMQIPIGVIPGL